MMQQRKKRPKGRDDSVDPLFTDPGQTKEPVATPTTTGGPSANLTAARGQTSSVEPQQNQMPVEPSLSDMDTLGAAPEVTQTTESNKAVGTTTSATANTEPNSTRKGEQTKKAPRLESDVELGESKSQKAGGTAAPSVNSEDTSTVSAEIHKAELASKPQLDRDSSTVVTELVARINNAEPIEQQGLLALFRKHDFKFHRKVHIYGLNQLTDMWRDIEFEMPSARFVELGVSIQLADREGAMTQKELHDFQQMVLEFTNEYDAPFEFSMNIDNALKQALALDQIGRRYDSMAVLNVVPKSKAGFRMADIESCARDLMMSTDKNGIFMKTHGQKNNITVLYRLACTDGSGQFGISSGSNTSVHDLVVYMNVPATEDPEMVFQEMVKDANSLATWLDGKVVDRQGRGMTQRSYSLLMQQVSDIAFSMQQDGFTPGDAVAKKLF